MTNKEMYPNLYGFVRTVCQDENPVAAARLIVSFVCSKSRPEDTIDGVKDVDLLLSKILPGSH